MITTVLHQIKYLCINRLFALAADQELTRTGASKAGETLEKAAEALMSCFRICAADT